MSEEGSFYKYLSKQFHDLESAKIWYRKWCDDWEQILPGENEAWCSLRAMAAHMSNVLEIKERGGVYSITEKGPCTNYIATKYGSEIYFAGY